MRLRRRSKTPDLRNLPLDRVDMFILSLLEGELTLAQLADMVSFCDIEETERRVYQLARLGLIEGPNVTTETSGVSVARVREPDPEDFATLRPPPPAAKRAPDADGIITLRPPTTAGADMEGIPTLRPPPSFGNESTTATRSLPGRGYEKVPRLNPVASFKDLGVPASHVTSDATRKRGTPRG